MTDLLFYIFAGFTILSAFCVVINQNAVNSAMFMILTFVGVASLSITMQAYFMAILQVLVYGGAIMVLFLFIIMLLGVEGGDKLKPNMLTVLASVSFLAIALVGTVIAFSLFDSPSLGIETSTSISSEADFLVFSSQTSQLGYGLFTKYMLPVQVAGFLLLVAMIGVIYLSKKEVVKTETLDEPIKGSVAGSEVS
jgi:NADH-quinone oxidoreductase subunit J